MNACAALPVAKKAKMNMLQDISGTLISIDSRKKEIANLLRDLRDTGGMDSSKKVKSLANSADVGTHQSFRYITQFADDDCMACWYVNAPQILD